ncbi:UNVERIFIED_ORG: hypothetical protein ABIC62_001357 [Burkholderia sp. 1595]|jgi:hypothetical protein|uniref:GcrA cell cycle regulator n=1 Tax=Paraburkholderia terricola TaxID=169427 RepID=A0ABU1LLS8_9BURK|nr:hypothetical protein [Paraburkholderia terricola]MDR6480295.1 hypothetical protein [Paraburkholderia terricola]
MMNAVAYRCGGSAGSRVLANDAPCFPFNCAHYESARGHQSAASLGAAPEPVKNR